MKKNYKLLTPGPLTTTETVKQQMMFDHCTWDDDYKEITQKIRRELLKLAGVTEPEYTVVLMQGSGSFGVESVLTSVVGNGDKLLIAANGAYGERMEDMAVHAGLDYRIYHQDYRQTPSAAEISQILSEDPSITHVAMVHSETTTGILNDIASVCRVVKAAGKTMIVDAMSSFAGVEIPVGDLGIDFLISSANKCIQGVPGFSFIICNRQKLTESQGKAKSLCLDLYDQWKTMEKDGKWRFTSPTHTVLAFAQALKELEAEGGIKARSARYAHNNHLLIEGMEKMGFQPYIDKEQQGPIITTFLYPQGVHISFGDMYHFMKERGYAIYPGKLKWDHIRTMLSMPRITSLWRQEYGRDPEDRDADRLYQQFEPRILTILDQYSDPKPYVIETIKALRERGIRIGSTTGYTDRMMEIVTRTAREKGYEPNCWFSPDSTGGKGRPFPYMIFRNMEALGAASVKRVLKVGDTLSDIREGVHAGVKTVGILEGSSLVGLSEKEMEALSCEERSQVFDKARKAYLEAGADWVVEDIRGIFDLIQ